jgi:hypothetical protein
MSVGLKIDDYGRLFIAGGDGTDQGWVVDSQTGKILKSYIFSNDTAPSFTNNVLLAYDAVWFTDSLKGVLYKLPLPVSNEDDLPTKAETLVLAGDGFNKSYIIDGISATPDGTGLIVDQTNNGKLYHVDPETGLTQEIYQAGMNGQRILTADSLLLLDNVLYVSDRIGNLFWLFELNSSGTVARYITKLTDSRFFGSTGLAPFGSRLYMPNSKGIYNITADTTYDAVSVCRPIANLGYELEHICSSPYANLSNSRIA